MLVALTGIEPTCSHVDSVQLVLSSSVFSLIGISGRERTPLRSADVMTRS
jgi:hypothetical protein